MLVLRFIFRASVVAALVLIFGGLIGLMFVPEAAGMLYAVASYAVAMLALGLATLVEMLVGG